MIWVRFLGFGGDFAKQNQTVAWDGAGFQWLGEKLRSRFLSRWGKSVREFLILVVLIW